MTPAILVPLDGSPEAATILPHVAALAGGREVILLHVALPPVVRQPLVGALGRAGGTYSAWEPSPSPAYRYLHTAAADLAAQGLRVRRLTLDGDPATALIAYVHDHPEVQQIALAVPAPGAAATWPLAQIAAMVLQAIPGPSVTVRPAPAQVPAVPGVPARLEVPSIGDVTTATYPVTATQSTLAISA
jgi:nucleotide-binding universal stress UspA family protein